MLLNKIPLSFSHIFLLFLYHLNWYQVQCATYRIEFDAKFSPPAVIPKDPKDLVYSVPLGQAINQPIIVYVRDVTNKIVTPKGNPVVTVSSLDASELKGIGADNWKTNGGTLCQRTNVGAIWPLRLDRGKYTKECGSTYDKTVLIRKFVNNMIILDWLIHENDKGIVPSDSRFLRVSIPDMGLTIDSALFNVTIPAAALIITKQPPQSITANTGFDISAEIHDIKRNLITEGLDSVPYVELTVPYEYKQFYHADGRNMMLYSTDIRLGGDGVATHEGTKDLVIRKQASGGRVHFKDIRILDIATILQLNLTMYMSRDPWYRTPNSYADIDEKDVDEFRIVRFRKMPKSLLKRTPAVILTTDFDVVEQILVSLFLSQPSKHTSGPLAITRNFPFPGPMYIEARDKLGHRIYSGSNANIPIEIETSPPDICISEDRTKYIRGGYGELVGSICQIAKSVHLILYSRMKPSVRTNSTVFHVGGNVHVAHFDHLVFSGAGWDIEPHTNSFIKFSSRDINTGAIPGVLKHFQMKIFVDTIETHEDVARTLDMYGRIRDRGEREPSTTPRLIIMPKNEETAGAMIRDVNNDEITMIAISQKITEFTNEYFFNRLCWNWDQITNYFLTACEERGWYYVAIVQMSDEMIPEAFLRIAPLLNITFHEEVSIPVFDPEQWKEGMLSEQIEELRNLSTKIIICLVNSTYQPMLLSEAARLQLSSREGYQWIFLSDHAWGFPVKSLCGNVSCAEAFKGTLLFTEFYNNSNFDTKDWHRVLGHFFASERLGLMGLDATYPDSDSGSTMALGYDAVWLFATALNRIISWQNTATGRRITEVLRELTIGGLTGELKLSSAGEREGYLGTIKAVNHEHEHGIELIRYITSLDRGIQVELKYGTEPKYFDTDSKKTITITPLPSSDVYNVREFLSFSGGISEYNNMLIEDKTEAWPPIKMFRFEKVVPQFTCKGSCGKRVDIKDVNLYDRGTCIEMDKCDCKFGYYGDNCEGVSCACLYGHCKTPFNCTCQEDWQGTICDKPICTQGCGAGTCVEPDVCKCPSRAWVGPDCGHHLASIITPLLIIIGVATFLVYKGTFKLKEYLHHRAALSNLSWLVIWTDVSHVDSAGTSKTSCLLSELYTWNREKWFTKTFNSKTIDVDDSKVRFDMVELMSLHHKNFITYGGACLTYPNVCLLLEPTLKGSLEDVLVNDSIELGWDFRFSFLKDICSGMHYLHTKTSIRSHGRLKSSNCLLDKRWTIRLSGFGVPIIRYGPYSLLQTNQDDPEVYQENQTSLLWTAPELLETATCLDDIRMGTQDGDCYSFGIIISEIITRAIPYAYERCFLSIMGILDLISDHENPSLDAERETWISLGGDVSCVRPQITSDQLPEGKSTRNKFKKMLDDVWCEEPQLRLSFQKLIPLLDKIHPSKGELMDNLISLLESYSSNLEHVVEERTADLEIEKVKIDNIISQMLPRQVVESLKNGDKVQPEVFENVTVFYSDIVGFTTIAKKSQPMQVVDLLNTLYGKFDSILAQHDVYKVETIGDAYVVSSGVPERNGNLHAGEIATASIDIVCTIMTVPIPHLPDDRLLLRVGIHSGSVVAGVVGLKMPRYTLFGETMQIAANMESSSKPLHVQMSHDSQSILKELGGYHYKRRGEKEVCGRKIITYWLIGKDGYPKTLPDVED